MILEKVRKTIKDHTLTGRGERIVLGLSGGPDSVCLFHVLLRLAPEMELEILPVHINHMFRPGAAERDQEYVEKLCREAGIECRVFTVDCNALAKEQDLTPEEAGRQARYEAFYRVASELAGTAEPAGVDQTEPAGVDQTETADADQTESADAKATTAPGVSIAIAQNANDQAETILHRIIRGTGPDGLAGIAYKRYEKDIPVIRPLIDVTRAEIEEYCRIHGLDPVIDHTNMEPVYLRNRIRLELLPLLEKYNSNIVETLTRLARIAAADREYLQKETDEAFLRALISEKTDDGDRPGRAPADLMQPASILLDRARLAEMEDPIRHRVVRLAFEKIGLIQDITEERLLAADAIIMKKQAPKTVEFPHGYRLTVGRGRVCFTGPGEAPAR